MDRAGKFKQGHPVFSVAAEGLRRRARRMGVFTVNRLRFRSPIASAGAAREPLATDRSRRLRLFAGLSGASAALLVVLVLSAGSAAAQGHSRADEDACTPDVYRLCGDYVPNQARIVSCLRAKRSRLSPACRAVMTRHGSRSSRRR